MTVDILMCTYNGEDFIEGQIQSILDQTYTDFRLIIVDDISEDRTVEIIKKMMISDSRIELYQNKKNLGYFTNFLFGLDFVTAEYLFFSDQDDIWLKSKIEIQLADLQKEEENILMNFSNSYLLYNEIPNYNNFASKRNAGQIKTYYSSSIELALKNIVAGHTILIRANQIPRIKDKMSKIVDRNNLYFDYVLTLILLEFGKIKFLNESLVHFRQHPNSTSTKMRMSYYKYVSSNAHAFSQISEYQKNVKYFTVLNNTYLKKANFPAYFKFLYQNLINSKHLYNNYNFYKLDVTPSYFRKISTSFKVSRSFYLQK